MLEAKTLTSNWKLDFQKSYFDVPRAKIKPDSSEYLFSLESDELVIDPVEIS